MFHFLIACIILFFLLQGILYLERTVVEHRKIRKHAYINAQQKIYETYQLSTEDFVIQYTTQEASPSCSTLALEVYPVVGKLYEISSTETSATAQHYHIFVTPQADVLPLTLPDHAGEQYSLEPMLTQTIFTSPLTTSRKEVMTWFEDFMEQHGVSESSLSVVDQGFQYRYRVNLLNVPCTYWWEQIPLEVTEWQVFPGTPKIQSAITGL